MSATYLKITLLSLLCVSLGHAVEVDTGSMENESIFAIAFPEGARGLAVKANNVSSISLQEYITASYRVVELNIVTNGSALIRIYYSRLLRPGEAQSALSDAASDMPGSSIIRSPMPGAVQKMTEKASGMADNATSNTVIKEYPLATHARTIEYRLRNRSDVTDLYDQLMAFWTSELMYFDKDGNLVDKDAPGAEEKPASLGGTSFSVGG